MKKIPSPLRHPRPLILALLTVGALATCIAVEELPLPHLTEQWEPKPPTVEAPKNAPPSDAIVLFDGSNLDSWETDCPDDGSQWEIQDGALAVVPVPKKGCNIQTRKGFGDVQLHLEFRTPSVVKKEGQGRGNSGVFLMGQYEVQILDSWDNETYVNGQLGSIYKQYPPLVNPARKPGEWQAYDIIFIAPRFKEDGSLKSPARITAILNGVLVQYDSELLGQTTFRGPPSYNMHSQKLPLVLQDHGDLVSFRNIWVRELDGEEIRDRTTLAFE